MDNKKKIYIGIGAVVVSVVAILFLKKRASKNRETEYFPVPTTPSGSETKPIEKFDPKPFAVNLKTAMKGWGTDEDMIWNTLSPLSQKQRIAVETYFNKNLGEGDTLEAWLKGDLGSDDLERAMDMLRAK